MFIARTLCSLLLSFTYLLAVASKQMGWSVWKKWKHFKEKKLCDSVVVVKQPFHLLTTTLLSLLLPLSFLLLARLSSASAHHSIFRLAAPAPVVQPLSAVLFSVVLSAHPTLLYMLVSFIGIATLLHILTGRSTLFFSSKKQSPILRPHLYIAWILLCALQVFVGLGIEGSIAAGIEGFPDPVDRSLLSRFIFIIGLHETMLHWLRMIVKPVVDDTIFGVTREENWVQRVAVAASFGCLWWWRLREEVESLILVADASSSGGKLTAEQFGWWLYYLIATIGMVKSGKGLIWILMVFCKALRKVEKIPADSSIIEDNV